MNSFNDTNRYYEKYKNQEFILQQKGFTRMIKVVICGYSADNEEILIGRLDKDSGISGFDKVSVGDFIPNPLPNANYCYINRKEIDKIVVEEVLNKKALRKQLN